MRYAIIASLILHSIVIGRLLWGGGDSATKAYPRIMSVDLVSMPPAIRGSPDFQSQPETQTKAVQKAHTRNIPETPHTTEIQKDKRQARPKQPQPTKPAVESKPVRADTRAGLPQGLTYGSEFGDLSIEGGKFETPTYLNILFAKIKSRWDNPFQGAEEISCVIYFVIERGGQISDAAIEKSSGITAFDQSALRAVLSSNPPPLPVEYSGNQLGIHLEFQYLPQ